MVQGIYLNVKIPFLSQGKIEHVLLVVKQHREPQGFESENVAIFAENQHFKFFLTQCLHFE